MTDEDRKAIYDEVWAFDDDHRATVDGIIDATVAWMLGPGGYVKASTVRDQIPALLERAQEDTVASHPNDGESHRYWIEEGANSLAAYIHHALNTDKATA